MMKKNQSILYLLFFLYSINLSAKDISIKEKELASAGLEKKITLKVVLNNKMEPEYRIINSDQKIINVKAFEKYEACAKYTVSLKRVASLKDGLTFFMSEIAPNSCSGDASDVQVIAVGANQVILGPKYSYVGEGGVERSFDLSSFSKDQTIRQIVWISAEDATSKKAKIYKKDLTRSEDPVAVVETLTTWKKDHFVTNEVFNY